MGLAPPQTSPASIREGEGGGCPAGAKRRRRHRGEATESEERDATLATYVRKVDETIKTCI